MKRAIYAGSFDPFTNGHLYVYNQAKEIFDEVVILFAVHPEKKRTTDVTGMIEQVQKVIGDPCVFGYSGLVADYCKENDIKYLIRGLRNTSDYLYEENIAKVNEEIWHELKTIYVRADNDVISSSMIRVLKANGKDVSKYLPNGITI